MYLKTHLGKHLYIHAYLQNILRCICNLCHYVIVMIIYQLLIADPSLNSFRQDIVYPHAPLITHYRSFDLLVVSQSHAGNRYQSSLLTDKTQNMSTDQNRYCAKNTLLFRQDNMVLAVILQYSRD